MQNFTHTYIAYFNTYFTLQLHMLTLHYTLYIHTLHILHTDITHFTYTHISRIQILHTLHAHIHLHTLYTYLHICMMPTNMHTFLQTLCNAYIQSHITYLFACLFAFKHICDNFAYICSHKIQTFTHALYS